MRVTDKMFTDRSLAGLRDRRRDYLEAQEQATSGRRAVRPSDDPIAMSRARRFQTEANRAEGHQRAATAVESRLQVMDGAIGEAESLMARAREIAVQGSNASLTAADRQALAEETDQLFEHLKALGNSKIGDKFIFSGITQNTPPFSPTGAYGGSNSIQEVEVAPGMRVAMGVSGEDLFANPSGDAMAALQQLRDGLATNNLSQVQGALDSVGTAGDVISDARSRVGAQMVSVDMAKSITSRTQYQAEENVVDEVGADMFQAYSDLTRAQAALAAAVEIAGQLPLPGLASR